MKPRVLPITGKKNNTKRPTTNVQIKRYAKYAWGASSGFLADLKVNKPNQSIIITN